MALRYQLDAGLGELTPFHTVRRMPAPKSQATSLYRKLGVSSRSQAVTRSGELGLLEG
jgi:hypothetical protein